MFPIANPALSDRSAYVSAHAPSLISSPAAGYSRCPTDSDSGSPSSPQPSQRGDRLLGTAKRHLCSREAHRVIEPGLRELLGMPMRLIARADSRELFPASFRVTLHEALRLLEEILTLESACALQQHGCDPVSRPAIRLKGSLASRLVRGESCIEAIAAGKDIDLLLDAADLVPADWQPAQKTMFAAGVVVRWVYALQHGLAADQVQGQISRREWKTLFDDFFCSRFALFDRSGMGGSERDCWALYSCCLELESGAESQIDVMVSFRLARPFLSDDAAFEIALPLQAEAAELTCWVPPKNALRSMESGTFVVPRLDQVQRGALERVLIRQAAGQRYGWEDPATEQRALLDHFLQTIGGDHPAVRRQGMTQLLARLDASWDLPQQMVYLLQLVQIFPECVAHVEWPEQGWPRELLPLRQWLRESSPEEMAVLAPRLTPFIAGLFTSVGWPSLPVWAPLACEHVVAVPEARFTRRLAAFLHQLMPVSAIGEADLGALRRWVGELRHHPQPDLEASALLKLLEQVRSDPATAECLAARCCLELSSLESARRLLSPWPRLMGCLAEEGACDLLKEICPPDRRAWWLKRLSRWPLIERLLEGLSRDQIADRPAILWHVLDARASRRQTLPLLLVEEVLQRDQARASPAASVPALMEAALQMTGGGPLLQRVAEAMAHLIQADGERGSPREWRAWMSMLPRLEQSAPSRLARILLTAAANKRWGQASGALERAVLDYLSRCWPDQEEADACVMLAQQFPAVRAALPTDLDQQLSPPAALMWLSQRGWSDWSERESSLLQRLLGEPGTRQMALDRAAEQGWPLEPASVWDSLQRQWLQAPDASERRRLLARMADWLESYPDVAPTESIRTLWQAVQDGGLCRGSERESIEVGLLRVARQLWRGANRPELLVLMARQWMQDPRLVATGCRAPDWAELLRSLAEAGVLVLRDWPERALSWLAEVDSFGVLEATSRQAWRNELQGLGVDVRRSLIFGCLAKGEVDDLEVRLAGAWAGLSDLMDWEQGPACLSESAPACLREGLLRLVTHAPSSAAFGFVQQSLLAGGVRALDALSTPSLWTARECVGDALRLSALARKGEIASQGTEADTSPGPDPGSERQLLEREGQLWRLAMVLSDRLEAAGVEIRIQRGLFEALANDILRHFRLEQSGTAERLERASRFQPGMASAVMVQLVHLMREVVPPAERAPLLARLLTQIPGDQLLRRDPVRQLELLQAEVLAALSDLLGPETGLESAQLEQLWACLASWLRCVNFDELAPFLLPRIKQVQHLALEACAASAGADVFSHSLRVLTTLALGLDGHAGLYPVLLDLIDQLESCVEKMAPGENRRQAAALLRGALFLTWRSWETTPSAAVFERRIKSSIQALEWWIDTPAALRQAGVCALLHGGAKGDWSPEQRARLALLLLALVAVEGAGKTWLVLYEKRELGAAARQVRDARELMGIRLAVCRGYARTVCREGAAADEARRNEMARAMTAFDRFDLFLCAEVARGVEGPLESWVQSTQLIRLGLVGPVLAGRAEERLAAALFLRASLRFCCMLQVENDPEGWRLGRAEHALLDDCQETLLNDLVELESQAPIELPEMLMTIVDQLSIGFLALQSEMLSATSPSGTGSSAPAHRSASRAGGSSTGRQVLQMASRVMDEGQVGLKRCGEALVKLRSLPRLVGAYQFLAMVDQASSGSERVPYQDWAAGMLVKLSTPLDERFKRLLAQIFSPEDHEARAEAFNELRLALFPLLALQVATDFSFDLLIRAARPLLQRSGALRASPLEAECASLEGLLVGRLSAAIQHLRADAQSIEMARAIWSCQHPSLCEQIEGWCAGQIKAAKGRAAKARWQAMATPLFEAMRHEKAQSSAGAGPAHP
jgi:hypothetical protein